MNKEQEKQVDSRELRKSMPNWFKRSPVGETILADTAVREAAKRKVVADRLAELRTEQGATLPALKKAAEAALARVESAREALKMAEQNHAVAAGKHMSKSIELGSLCDRLENLLRDTAPVEIDDFIYEMSELHEENRRRLQVMERTGKRNPIDDSAPVIVHTNLTALNARLAAIRAAMAAAEALRILPIVPLDLDGLLQALRHEVMSIDLGEVDRRQFGVEWESPTIVDSKGREYARN
jgi:hypothetical protein